MEINEKTELKSQIPPYCLGAVISPIKIYVKVKKCTTMHCENGNENGYVNYFLRLAFIRKRWSFLMYTKIIGNGDVGANCQY